MSVTKQKLEYGFPPEVRTWTRRDLVELMPPVLNEETDEVTYFCSICKEVKIANADDGVTYRHTIEPVLGGFYGSILEQGHICPDCEAERGE